MKNGYKMNFMSATLTITQNFEKRAMEIGSDEYEILRQLRVDFPNLRIVKKASPKRRNNVARPTYDKMVKFLSCQANASILLNEFTEIREYSKAQENPYQFVRKWFMLNFPNYQSIPMFERNGHIPAPSVNAEKHDVFLREEIKEVA